MSNLNNILDPKKPLSDVIADFIKFYADYKIHVALPVKVVKYNSDNQTVDCCRVIRARNNVTGEMDNPGKLLLTSIPVAYQAVDTDIYNALPIQKDMPGTVVFYDKSIDNWVNTDGTQIVDDDLDPRSHDMSDAFFIPGTFPFKKNLDGASTSDWIWRNKNMKITLDPDGKISIEGATDEVLTVVSDALGHISGYYTNMLTHLAALNIGVTALNTMGAALVVPTGLPDAGSKTAFTGAMGAWLASLTTMTTNVTTDKTNIDADKLKIDGLKI